MADIRVQTLADALGVPTMAAATLTAQVFEGLLPVVRVAGELVTFPEPAEMKLTGAPGETFPLYVLPPGLYWRIAVRTGLAYALTRNVVLPAGSGPFDFADLVDVNPVTALPDPGSALADAFIAELEAIRDATIAIAVDDVSVSAQISDGPLTGAALAAQPVSTATQTALDLKQDESAIDADVTAKVNDPGSALATALSATFGQNQVSALRLDFGVPTDGVTDATTGLQAWLAALTSSVVGVLPSGIYVQSNTLTIPANVTVYAAGVTLISVGAVDNSIMLSAGAKLIGPVTVQDSRGYTAGNEHVGISGIGITGFDLSDITVTGFGAFGILLSGCSDFSATNIRVTATGTANDGAGGWFGDGFWITGGCSDFRLSNLDVSGNGRHGLFIWYDLGTSAENFVVSGVVANENGDCGVQFTAVKGFSLGNVVADHNGVNGGPYGGQGVQVVGSAGSPTVYGHGTLYGITATDNLENGVELHYVNDVSWVGVTGLRNVWSALAVNNSQDVTGTVVTATGNGTTGVSIVGSTDISLMGVNAHNNAWDGVSVTNSCVRVMLIAIRANNNGQGGGTRTGIIASASTDITISDVQAFDTQGTATQDYGVRAYQVTGAEIRGVRGTGNSIRLVQVDGGTTSYALDNPADDSTTFKGRWNTNGIRDLSGTGSPEGIITAPIGSTYRRTDGGAGTSFYVKQSGTTATGWVGK